MNQHDFNQLLRQSLFLPVLLLLCLAAVLLLEVRATLRAAQVEQRSNKVIAELDDLLKLLVDQETGLRGYEITANQLFLQPYLSASPHIDENFNRLHNDLTGQRNLQDELATTRAEYVNWDRYAVNLQRLVSTNQEYRASDLNLEGKQRMDRLRAHFASMIERAASARDQRATLLAHQVRRIVETTLGLALFLGLLLGLLTRDQLHRVSAAYKELLKKAEDRADELYESRQSYYTTLQSIGDAVIACDAEGRITFMNKVAQDLCGVSQADAIRAPLDKIFNIVDETTRTVVENPVDKVRRLKRVVGLANHTVLLRPDGTEINIDDSGAPIRDQHGNLTGVVLVFRDITQERKTAHALLANEKLAVAGRLSATIAHEIHNPLDTVSSLLYLLRNDPTPEDGQRYLDLATQELTRVTQISRTMLSLYREAKAPVSLDLKDLIESVLVLMDRKLKETAVHLTREMPTEIRVEGFPAELRQVFTNLIANAIEAAGTGGAVKILLRASTNFSGAEVEISDNGPGITEDIQPKLFSPFFTTKGEQGTGLGLWVSRGIVNKYGGSIDLISSTDSQSHGTILRVFLPQKPVAIAVH